MIQLSDQTLGDLPAEVSPPAYRRDALAPAIFHVGVGGFHRSHQAYYLDELLRRGGDPRWSVGGIGVLPQDRAMAADLNRQDGLYTLVAKPPAGDPRPQVIGSLTGMRHLQDAGAEVLGHLTAPGTAIVSLTITEGGYPVDVATHEFDPGHLSVRADLEGDGDAPRTVIGMLVKALQVRHERGLPAFTVLSCDNIRGNGDVARESVRAFAALKAPAMADWVAQQVSFPNSMVDRITPVTTAEDRRWLAERFGVDDRRPVVCEDFLQWVVQDDFPAGRPALDDVGVQFAADVEPYELMKLRMLNAGHQVIGHVGRYAGLRHAHEVIGDPVLRRLLTNFLTAEAAPTLLPTPGQDPLTYRDSIVERFGNAHVRDTLARLCADASDRIPKFLLGTVRDNLASGGEVAISAFVLAAWALGVRGHDEAGAPVEVVDPLAASLTAASGAETRAPGAFLDHPVFEGLGADPRLRRSYLESLRAIQEDGIGAAARALL